MFEPLWLCETKGWLRGMVRNFPAGGNLLPLLAEVRLKENGAEQAAKMYSLQPARRSGSSLRAATRRYQNHSEVDGTVGETMIGGLFTGSQ